MTETASAGAPSLPKIQSSDAAIDLIVTEEDSGQAYYTRHYTHFEWPEGASGPTVGIGYDCGYCSADMIRADWAPYVDASTIAALIRASGLKGKAAAQFVSHHRASVTISWDQAMAQFKGNELVQWEARVRHDLPNTNLLSGDSFGALVSLAYNRGDSFHAPGARYLEMRAIADLMASKQFEKIPSEFLAMRRLWPVNSGVWKRRVHEATLFSKGLLAAPNTKEESK